MALSRIKTWAAAEVLYASDLNAEFNNPLNNALAMISPLTGTLAAGGFNITGLDELAFNDANANATATGRVRRNGANLTWHDGTSAKNIAFGGTIGTVTRSAGDVTTTSGTLVDLTGASITITTGAHQVLLLFSCTCNDATLNESIFFTFLVDGTNQYGTDGLGVKQMVAGNSYIVTMSFVTNALTAASHTFKVQWRTTTGSTGTVEASATRAYHFAAHDLGA